MADIYFNNQEIFTNETRVVIFPFERRELGMTGQIGKKSGVRLWTQDEDWLGEAGIA